MIQLIVDYIACPLPGLFNEYLEFSEVKDCFVLAMFIKTMNSVGKPLDHHLKKPGTQAAAPGLKITINFINMINFKYTLVYI